MCMMNNNLTQEQMDKAIEDVLAIIGSKGTKIESTRAKEQPVGQMITYDGYGTVIEIDGVKTHKATKKKRARVKTPKDGTREALNEAVEEFLKKTAAFEGKVYHNTKDGIVVRMADADYAVKASGHSTCEYDPTAEGFKASKSFATRGTAVNHASAIAKMITEQFENEFSKPFSEFKNENRILLCEAKASGIRVQINGNEFTVKISKKRERCIIELD